VKKFVVPLVFTVIFSTLCFATGKFENELFSINALTSDSDSTNYQPLSFSLPASSGFSPNVNLQIQQFDDTIQDYFNPSLKQFKQYKFKVIKTEQTKFSFSIEYSGKLQDFDLHWYAKTFKKDNSIFSITATCLESQWATFSKRLESCVNSFTLK